MFDGVGFSLDIRASSVWSMNRGGGGDGEQLSLSLVTFANFSFCFPFKLDFNFLHFGALPSDLPPTDQHWAILWPSFLQFVQKDFLLFCDFTFGSAGDQYFSLLWTIIALSCCCHNVVSCSRIKLMVSWRERDPDLFRMMVRRVLHSCGSAIKIAMA